MNNLSISLVSGPPIQAEPGLGTLTIPGFLRDVTARFGRREALVMHSGGHAIRWTYDDLWRETSDMARSFLAAGISKGSRVGIMISNRPEWLTCVFGCGLAGGVPVLISPTTDPAELRQIVESSAISHLILESDPQGNLPLEAFADIQTELDGCHPGQLRVAALPFLRHVIAIDYDGSNGLVESHEAFLRRGKTVPLALAVRSSEAVQPGDLGLLFFTSGSTGRPKGVLVSQCGAAIQCWRWRRIFALEDDIRCWSANSFSWSGNFGMAVGATLASGGCLVLQRTFDPAAALQLMAREKVTFPLAWPYQWDILAREANFLDTDLSGVRYVDATMSFARHPAITGHWRQPRAYGNTETLTICAAFPSNTPQEMAGDSAGVPLPGMTIKIIDPSSQDIMPIGFLGEIAVRGPTLMMGYDGQLREETFDDYGFFHTSDAGFIDREGRLHWKGRLADLDNGLDGAPGEIDAHLMAEGGARISQTIVIRDSQGRTGLVSFLVPETEGSVDRAACEAGIRERVGHGIETKVVLLRDGEMPITGSGKIKTAALRSLAARMFEPSG